mgnify:CR=1 FL=1
MSCYSGCNSGAVQCGGLVISGLAHVGQQMQLLAANQSCRVLAKLSAVLQLFTPCFTASRITA